MKKVINPDEEAYIGAFIRAEERIKLNCMSLKGKGKKNGVARQIRNSGELINVNKMFRYANKGY